MVPEAWQNDKYMSPDKRAFYRWSAFAMEPWDGPGLGSISFIELCGSGVLLVWLCLQLCEIVGHYTKLFNFVMVHGSALLCSFLYYVISFGRCALRKLEFEISSVCLVVKPFIPKGFFSCRAE